MALPHCRNFLHSSSATKMISAIVRSERDAAEKQHMVVSILYVVCAIQKIIGHAQNQQFVGRAFFGVLGQHVRTG